MLLVTGQLVDAPTHLLPARGLVNSRMPPLTVAVKMLKTTTAVKAFVDLGTILVGLLICIILCICS